MILELYRLLHGTGGRLHVLILIFQKSYDEDMILELYRLLHGTGGRLHVAILIFQKRL